MFSLDCPRVRKLALALILGISVLLVLAGCAFIDQLIAQLTGGSTPPPGDPGGSGTGAPTAVITAVVDDSVVDQGRNPDLRPPLWYTIDGLASTDRDGDPARYSDYGRHELAWDLGDGTVRGFEWNDYSMRHWFREEGTYTITLTVREPNGGPSDTVQETITLGPPWLEIVDPAVTPRPDGKVAVSVLVRNQSRQTLGKIGVEMIVDGSLYQDVTLGLVIEDTPLPPDGHYVLFDTMDPLPAGSTYYFRSGVCLPLGPP